MVHAEALRYKTPCPKIRAVIVRSKAPRNCFMKIPFKS